MRYFVQIATVLTVCLYVAHAAAQNKVVVIPFNTSKRLDNVVTVSTKGGDFNDPVAAVNSIMDASEANPYLVLIGPGVYTLIQPLIMKPFVSVAGSGQEVTQLRSSSTFGNSIPVSRSANRLEKATQAEKRISYINDNDIPRPLLTPDPPPADSAVVFGADNTTLSDLTIVETGVKELSFAIYNLGCSPIIHDVTAISSGGLNHCAVYNLHSSSPTMNNVTATSAGPWSNSGVCNEYSSSPVMNNVVATAVGGSFGNIGVFNYGSSPTMNNVTATATGGGLNAGVVSSSSSPAMNNVTAIASAGTATGSVSNTGIAISDYNFDSSSPYLNNVTATASGGENSIGVAIARSSPNLNNVAATASGATLVSYGASSTDASTTIRHSTLSGSSSGLYHEGGTTRVMQSSIIGGATNTSGTLTCVTSDNGAATALNSDCQ